MNRYISKHKNIKIGFLSLLVFIIPALVYAHSSGLTTCAGTKNDPCQFNDLIDLIRDIVSFLMFKVALPLSALLFSWAGVLMLTAGGSEEQIKKAKDIFFFVFIGILITLAAWLIVDTITGSLLTPEYKGFLTK